VIVQRALAVLSAVLLVGSVALATLGPHWATLGRALFAMNHDLPDGMQHWLQGHVGSWAWDILLPLIQRPAWLLPTSLGLICAGLSVSLSNRNTPHRSHRRS